MLINLRLNKPRRTEGSTKLKLIEFVQQQISSSLSYKRKFSITKISYFVNLPLPNLKFPIKPSKPFQKTLRILSI